MSKCSHVFDRKNACVTCNADFQAQRDAAISALQALYDAIPTGFGEDRALNEATKQAEQVLGVKQ